MAEISRVNLDIARFAKEVYQRRNDKELARWVREVTDALVTRDGSLNPFAKHLLAEASDFAAKFSARQRENAKKRWLKDAMAMPNDAVASGGNAKPCHDMPTHAHTINQSEHRRSSPGRGNVEENHTSMGAPSYGAGVAA